MSNMPKAEGFYWGKWKIAAEGTRDENEACPSNEWEVMHVVENCNDPTSDEFLMVMVPGVGKWQPLENFFWGTGPITVPDEGGGADCQCPTCGRLHKRSHRLPASLGGELSHRQYCRLSRVFNRSAELGIGTPDYDINEWLKLKIAAANTPNQPPKGEG